MWSNPHLLKKSLTENFIFVQCVPWEKDIKIPTNTTLPSGVFVPIAGKLGSAFELTNINLSHLLPHVSLTGVPLGTRLLGDVMTQHNILTLLELLGFGRNLTVKLSRPHFVACLELRNTVIRVPMQMPRKICIIDSFVTGTIFVS